jgi:VWFA-related protein
MRRHTLLAWVVAVAVAAAGPLLAQQPPPQKPQPPVFRAGVDLVSVDVQVVADDGNPIVDLTAADFTVAIDGRPRRVASAELVRFAAPEPAAARPAAPIRTPGRLPADARVFVLAVDLMGFTTGDIMPLRAAVRGFLDQLRPEDMIGLYAFPFQARGLDLTHDHQALVPALERLVGMRDTRLGVFNMTPSEIVGITASDQETTERVISRECDPDDPSCPHAVRGEASALGTYLEAEASQRIGGLLDLAGALAVIPGRKTVVLLSGSLISSPASRGRPDVSGSLHRVGELLSAAEVNLYTLHWDTSFLDAFSASHGLSRRPADRFLSLSADRHALAAGLEVLTGKAGGALLRVEAGTGDNAFTRVLRENTAYYLLGIEPDARDRDGKPHVLRIRVTRRGATVRGRTHVLIPGGTSPLVSAGDWQ